MWQVIKMSSKYLGGFLAGLSRRLYTGARRNVGPGVRQQVDASAPALREVTRSPSLARKRFNELTQSGAPTFSHFLTDTHGRAHDYLRISISERWAVLTASHVLRLSHSCFPGAIYDVSIACRLTGSRWLPMPSSSRQMRSSKLPRFLWPRGSKRSTLIRGTHLWLAPV